MNDQIVVKHIRSELIQISQHPSIQGLEHVDGEIQNLLVQVSNPEFQQMLQNTQAILWRILRQPSHDFTSTEGSLDEVAKVARLAASTLSINSRARTCVDQVSRNPLEGDTL